MITKKRLLWTFVALGAAVGFWILVGGLVAQWKESALNRRWGETLSPLESLLDRFPKVEVNNSALTLEALATSLGIDLAPLEARDRSHPSPASRKGLEDVSLE